MNSSTVIASRQSKYCTALRIAVQKLGHATNAMLLEELRHEFPEVSATTIHRATTRLGARGGLMLAPSDLKGAMRYETPKAEHDHFLCNKCGLLRDVDVVSDVTGILKSKLNGCYPSGRIVVSGVCVHCS
jgi:Fe2+ or Zn2+ uptake regulation protein